MKEIGLDGEFTLVRRGSLSIYFRAFGDASDKIELLTVLAFFIVSFFAGGDRHYKRNFRLIKDIKVAT